jgi:hypothetical protein
MEAKKNPAIWNTRMILLIPCLGNCRLIESLPIALSLWSPMSRFFFLSSKPDALTLSTLDLGDPPA